MFKKLQQSTKVFILVVGFVVCFVVIARLLAILLLPQPTEASNSEMRAFAHQVIQEHTILASAEEKRVLFIKMHGINTHTWTNDEQAYYATLVSTIDAQNNIYIRTCSTYERAWNKFALSTDFPQSCSGVLGMNLSPEPPHN